MPISAPVSAIALGLISDEDKEKYIISGTDETYTIFDSAKKSYGKVKEDVLVKEYYFRPCHQYPRGYFYIATKDGTLAEGELPGAVFPIISGIMDKFQTTPRGRSVLKQGRAYQAEINRVASKIAEHHMTLGDDKLILQNGSEATAGSSLPGIRTITVNGAAPTVLGGRDGSQYFEYMQGQIAEYYEVMNVAEDSALKADGQVDPYALLFKAASQKKNFQRYVRRFERFLVDVAKTHSRLAKIFLPDDQLIYAIGKKEQVNIQEFKNATDICYQIKAVPQSDDVETKMGKQLILNHALQYTANKLDKEDIGKLIRAMPFSNVEESFSDLTLDYDSVTNDILAMDRGEIPQIHESDNHVYAMKRAAARKRQSDFTLLGPQIAQTYEQYLAQHSAFEAGGYLVGCDFYTNDPANPGKTVRAKVPYLALQWLIDKLATQGQGQEELMAMDQQSQGRMASQLQLHQGGQPPNGMGGGTPLQGQASPGREMNGNAGRFPGAS